MQMYRSFWIGSIALMLLSGLAARADDAKNGPELQAGPVRVTVTQKEADGPGKRVQIRVEAKEGPGESIRVWNLEGGRPLPAGGVELPLQAIKLGDYWLGVECRPVDDALRAQLGLPEDQGLVVENVVPDGPAAKAGIQRHDVLVKAGDEPLKDLRVLIDAIEKTQEKELVIELLRGGKKETVQVTPAKRPKETGPKEFLPWSGGEPPRGLERPWNVFEEWLKGDGEKGPMRFRFFHPGTILPSDAWPHPPLPGNLSVTITKEGDKPAKIVVSRGDEKWELTEKEVDKLPEDIRPHVERMLGRAAKAPMGQFKPFDYVPDWTPPGWREGPQKERPAPPADALQRRIEKRIEEMNQRIENLRKSIEELRKGRPRLEGAPKETPDEE